MSAKFPLPLLMRKVQRIFEVEIFTTSPEAEVGHYCPSPQKIKELQAELCVPLNVQTRLHDLAEPKLCSCGKPLAVYVVPEKKAYCEDCLCT